MTQLGLPIAASRDGARSQPPATGSARHTSAKPRGRSRLAFVTGLTLTLTTILVACGGDDNDAASGGTPTTSEPALPTPITSLATGCPNYTSEDLPFGAKVTSTQIKPASGVFTEVCVVRGTIVSGPNSTITWAVEVPEPSNWNGKTVTIGGGTNDGFIPTDSYPRIYAGAASNNYVKISSDSGHQVRTFYPWGNDDVALKNHGYEANHHLNP